MGEKLTSDEALAMAIESYKRVSLPGSNNAKDVNHIVAKNVVESERGRYSDLQRDYDLDQATRDRLLVHARQDIAEALLHTRSMMDEICRLKKTQSNLSYVLLLLFVAFAVWKYWSFIN